MNIFTNDNSNFYNNGLGFLNETISAEVTEYLNGDMSLTLTYPANSAMSQYIVEENIIRCNVGSQNKQLFRIKKVIKSFKEITAYATHIFYDLNNNMVVDTAPTNQEAEAFGNWILNHTNYENPFTFQSDISGAKSARYVRRNPVETIIGDIDNSMINLFGGDLERDNFTIKLLAHRGSRTPKRLLFGKNIEEIQITKDSTSVYTRIMPIGYDGLILPEKFVDSDRITDYPTPRITKVEFPDIKYDPESEDEEVYTNIEDAYEALRTETRKLFDSGIDEPTINIKIDWVELSKTKEYHDRYAALEETHIGDEITADIMGLSYDARITKTTYNVLNDTIESYEVGTTQKTISNTINNTSKKIEDINVTSILQEAKDNASSLIKTAMGGYIYKTQNELFIMDTDNPNTAQKVWRWNLNGLGYSNTGINGTYQTAMTKDGQIVADMITTGTMSAERITGLREIVLSEYGDYLHVDRETGELILGGQSDLTLHIDEDGISIYQGSEKLSWWVEDTFTATQLNLGNFAFIPRSNGSLGFRKVK